MSVLRTDRRKTLNQRRMPANAGRRKTRNERRTTQNLFLRRSALCPRFLRKRKLYPRKVRVVRGQCGAWQAPLKTTRLIGARCTYSNVLSRGLLIGHFTGTIRGCIFVRTSLRSARTKCKAKNEKCKTTAQNQKYIDRCLVLAFRFKFLV